MMCHAINAYGATADNLPVVRDQLWYETVDATVCITIGFTRTDNSNSFGRIFERSSFAVEDEWWMMNLFEYLGVCGLLFFVP